MPNVKIIEQKDTIEFGVIGIGTWFTIDDKLCLKVRPSTENDNCYCADDDGWYSLKYRTPVRVVPGDTIDITVKRG